MGLAGVACAIGHQLDRCRQRGNTGNRVDCGRQRRPRDCGKGISLIGGIEREARRYRVRRVALVVAVGRLGIYSIGRLAHHLDLETAAILLNRPAVKLAGAYCDIGQGHGVLPVVGHAVGQDILVGASEIVRHEDAHLAVAPVQGCAGLPVQGAVAANRTHIALGHTVDLGDSEWLALHDSHLHRLAVVARVVAHSRHEGVDARHRAVGIGLEQVFVGFHIHRVDISGLKGHAAVARLLEGRLERVGIVHIVERHIVGVHTVVVAARVACRSGHRHCNLEVASGGHSILGPELLAVDYGSLALLVAGTGAVYSRVVLHLHQLRTRLVGVVVDVGQHRPHLCNARQGKEVARRAVAHHTRALARFGTVGIILLVRVRGSEAMPYLVGNGRERVDCHGSSLVVAHGTAQPGSAGTAAARVAHHNAQVVAVGHIEQAVDILAAQYQVDGTRGLVADLGIVEEDETVVAHHLEGYAHRLAIELVERLLETIPPVVYLGSHLIFVGTGVAAILGEPHIDILGCHKRGESEGVDAACVAHNTALVAVVKVRRHAPLPPADYCLIARVNLQQAPTRSLRGHLGLGPRRRAQQHPCSQGRQQSQIFRKIISHILIF